jgi:phage tail-like protein
MDFKARVWATRLLVVAIALVAVVAVNAQKNQRNDPLPGYFFQVEIDGQAISFFKSVGGLKMDTEVTEFREGGQTDSTRKLAGATRYTNIRLTRGFTGDRSLYDWFITTQKPNPVRVNGRIVMFDRRGNRVAVFKFVNGFPAKWEGPDLDASKNEIAIETLEIAHEGLTLSLDDDN